MLHDIVRHQRILFALDFVLAHITFRPQVDGLIQKTLKRAKGSAAHSDIDLLRNFTRHIRISFLLESESFLSQRAFSVRSPSAVLAQMPFNY